MCALPFNSEVVQTHMCWSVFEIIYQTRKEYETCCNVADDCYGYSTNYIYYLNLIKRWHKKWYDGTQ